ncbi:protein FREE1-like [Neltuma alba]|uniref:protein FREE1-like n=1 Tax=Neltuma alba TaxID=207710 RepID=UPI0010A44EED|nr:protein FREE1-like [Prosopis alba]XP_028794266.1 protein FREE1-like [Prosopis alba]
MQQGDYSSAPYYQFPPAQKPNPYASADAIPNTYASAPPFSSGYTPDYTSYTPTCPPNPPNPETISAPTPATPSAPSYSPPSTFSSQPVSSSPQPSSFPPFDSHLSYQQLSTQQSYYPPYDRHQTAPSYAHSSSASQNLSLNSSFSFSHASPYGQPGSSMPSTNEIPCVDPAKFDHGGAYLDDRYGGFNQSPSGLGSDFYGNRQDGGISTYDRALDEVYGEGVYAYEGGKVEPYGARGTAPKSPWSGFDDYGRPINFPSPKETSISNKVSKAVPKADAQEGVRSGVQKFRVKLLAESSGQNTMDVLLQIGLDGVRMLDPSTSRILRIYPLENITRCERFDSSTLAFWSKSSVDIEPKRIRLQSNSYTTNTLLDTVTAATIQFKEMGGSSRPAEALKTNEQATEKKKGLVDWMNLIKPPNEEKDHWVPDEAASKCTACGTDFNAFVRKHHCRNCGDIFCDKCTQGRIALTADENALPVRVCDRCMAEVTRRLSYAKEAASRPVLQSHEDLARKLQEELERNRKTSGLESDGSGRRMKEVECPTCTVHLQVAVPDTGSETIECGVCQRPFLVSAR